MSKEENNLIREELKEKLLSQLEWVKYRIHMLDIMEKKLYKMKAIAEKAANNGSKEEMEELNKKIKYLEMQVNALDEESRYE